MIVGHRGAAGLAPENTLTAFALAAELGIDAIELDVLLTADGELVVHHDFRLNPETTRLPDGSGVGNSQRLPIKDLTVDQLKKYTVGRIDPGARYEKRYPSQQPADGESIPTLREVIALLRQKAAPDLELWIEIKTSPEAPELTPPVHTVADAVAQVVLSEKFVPRTRILSFDWRALARIQKTAPDIPTVYLTSRYKQFKPLNRAVTLSWTAGIDPADFGGSVPRMIKAAGGRYWGAKHTQISAKQIQESHDLGIAVYVWTVDAVSDMHRLLQLGVDGIVTNRPDRLQSLLRGSE
jgi:glycerophosphoryl diester phosphodiesterase